MTNWRSYLVKHTSRARWQGRMLCCTFRSDPPAGCPLGVAPAPAEAGCASCPSPASIRDAWMACTSIASSASLQAQARTLMLGLQTGSSPSLVNWVSHPRRANPCCNLIAQTSACGEPQAWQAQQGVTEGTECNADIDLNTYQNVGNHACWTLMSRTGAYARADYGCSTVGRVISRDIDSAADWTDQQTDL